MTPASLGPALQSFFVADLQTMKGLRPASIRSYRDVLRLFLCFVASDSGRRLSHLRLVDLTFETVLRFLKHLEEARGNTVRTRNHRLAVLHAFFEHLARSAPEMLAVAQRVAAIPAKRTPPPETRFLEREDMAALFTSMPKTGRHAMRDRALLLFLYNTGARVQEAADVRIRDVDLEGTPRVRLHGKGDKWRMCPLWPETARQLEALLGARRPPDGPVFVSVGSRPLTRFGIYKIVRRHTASLDRAHLRKVGPHVFRHTTAVHLLEAGVEVNVIRGWLGHVSLDTTNRYAEINIRAKEAALRACEPPVESSAGFPSKPVWRDDETMLAWLESL